MQRLFICLTFLVLIFSSSTHAQIFKPTVFTLNNGMQVAVIEKPGLPVVSHMVWYKVGARDDPQGEKGIAHFLEHMMFRGTQKVPNGEFSRQVAIMGGQDNAFTSWDFTAYFQNIPVDALETMMTLESDRMANLVLNREVFETERNVILEERAQRTDNSPAAQLFEQAARAFYLNQPYGVPIIGWESDIKAISYENMKDFYQRYYAPNNALLVVSGGVDAATVRQLAKKTYGKVPRRAIKRTPLPQEPEHLVTRDIELVHENVRQPYVSLWWPAPSYMAGADEHVYGLQVLEELLGASETGDLYKHFVLETKQAISVSTSYSPMRAGQTAFRVTLVPAGDVSLEDLAAAVEKYIDTYVMRDDKRLADVLKRLKASAIFIQDSLSSGAYLFGQAFTIGLDFDVIENWPVRIGQVSLAEIDKAHEAVLKRPPTLITYLKDEK